MYVRFAGARCTEVGMGFIGARAILAESEMWVMQAVVAGGIAEEPADPFAPAAEKLYPVTFTSHQTGDVRHGMLRKALRGTTETDLQEAFKRAR